MTSTKSRIVGNMFNFSFQNHQKSEISRLCEDVTKNGSKRFKNALEEGDIPAEIFKVMKIREMFILKISEVTILPLPVHF